MLVDELVAAAAVVVVDGLVEVAGALVVAVDVLVVAAVAGSIQA